MRKIHFFGKLTIVVPKSAKTHLDLALRILLPAAFHIFQLSKWTVVCVRVRRNSHQGHGKSKESFKAITKTNFLSLICFLDKVAAGRTEEIAFQRDYFSLHGQPGPVRQ